MVMNEWTELRGSSYTSLLHFPIVHCPEMWCQTCWLAFVTFHTHSHTQTPTRMAWLVRDEETKQKPSRFPVGGSCEGRVFGRKSLNQEISFSSIVGQSKSFPKRRSAVVFRLHSWLSFALLVKQKNKQTHIRTHNRHVIIITKCQRHYERNEVNVHVNVKKWRSTYVFDQCSVFTIYIYVACYLVKGRCTSCKLRPTMKLICIVETSIRPREEILFVPHSSWWHFSSFCHPRTVWVYERALWLVIQWTRSSKVRPKQRPL